jgi:hypothetical protein
MKAYCGINCGECPCYKGTVQGDISMLEKTAREWSGKDTTYKTLDMVCLGCTKENKNFHFPYCNTCAVRLCAMAKDVQNCAACSDFETCDHIGSFLKDHARPKASMELLRQKFLAGA